jgi:hypothetical protein
MGASPREIPTIHVQKSTTRVGDPALTWSDAIGNRMSRTSCRIRQDVVTGHRPQPYHFRAAPDGEEFLDEASPKAPVPSVL